MRSSSTKRTTAKERELTERIRELEEKLAASVPKAEFETLKSSMQLEISDLKTKLSIAEVQASQAALPEPEVTGRLDEDGFEEREAEGMTAEASQMRFSTEHPADEDSEESEKDSEESEDSEQS